MCWNVRTGKGTCLFFSVLLRVQVKIHSKGDMKVQDDHQLLERVRFGDETAFQELIKKHYRQVLSFSRQMGLASSALVHVTKEAFLETYQNYSSLTGETLRLWLFQKVHTLIIDQLSSHEKKEQQYEQKEMEEWFFVSQGAFTAEKASFLLHNLYGFTLEQTGEILHIGLEETKQEREKFLARLEKNGLDSQAVSERWKEAFARLPDEVTPEAIWAHIQNARKQRRIKIGRFIAIGGTLSALSLGIFLLISPSVFLPEERSPEPAPPAIEEVEEENDV